MHNTQAMAENLEAVLLALHVLSAVNTGFAPDAKDVEALRRMAPEEKDLQVDELACVIIQRALRDRREKMGSRTPGKRSTDTA